MKRLEDYLSDATRGLFGRRKKAVQLELRGAIEDKLHRYQIAGMSEEQALERTLQDLGSARALRGGFFRLHSAPLLGQLGALVLASSAAVLALWPSSVAQVAATQAKPYKIDCVALTKPSAFDKLTPAQRRLIESLVPKSGQNFDTRRVLELCDARLKTYEYLKLSDLEREWRKMGALLRPLAKGPGVQFEGTSIEVPVTSEMVVKGEQYIGFYQLGLFLNRSYLPLKLEGWTNPKIYVGARSFQLGTPTTPISAESVYTALLNAAQMNGGAFQELEMIRLSSGQMVVPGDSLNGDSDISLDLASLTLKMKDQELVAFVYVGDAQLRFFNVLRMQDGQLEIPIGIKDARAFPPAATWEQLRTGKLERPQWLLLDLSKTTDWRKPQYSIIPPSSIKRQ